VKISFFIRFVASERGFSYIFVVVFYVFFPVFLGYVVNSEFVFLDFTRHLLLERPVLGVVFGVTVPCRII